MKSLGALLLFFTAAVAMAAPQVVSRSTVYGPFTPAPDPTLILSTAGEANLLFWTEETGGHVRIRGMNLGTGRVVDLPSFADGDMFAPAAASSGDEVFVVWYQQMMSGGFVYFGARIAPDGTALDSFPSILGSATSAAPPKIAWDGTEFLVAWSMKATIVTPGGVVTGLFPLSSGRYSQIDRIDLGGFDGHALSIAQGLLTPRQCDFYYHTCVDQVGPAVESYISDAAHVPTALTMPVTAAEKGHPLSIGVARDGFVVVWAEDTIIRVIQVPLVNGAFLPALDGGTASETPVQAVRAANDLVLWSAGNAISSNVGRLSAASETATAPDLLWTGGNRYLVAYIAGNGGASRIELLTIDNVTGRRRVAH